MKNEYTSFYKILSTLKEEFHRIGRIDDSNAKLDEIIKLLVIKHYLFFHDNSELNVEYLEQLSQKLFGEKTSLAKSLRYLFNEIAQYEIFINNDGTNIFGNNPTLAIQENENLIAKILVEEIGKINFNDLLETENNDQFDLINEIFGTFVRDNFRNNKEDAQYMTPKEITEPLFKIIFHDILSDQNAVKNILSNNFKIMDPTCGVGTLIIEAARYLISYINTLSLSKKEKLSLIHSFKLNGIYGQDKVDRMVRLSKVNSLLFNSNINNIFHGNSIIGDSALNNYDNVFDLIVTNPPFGAVYETKFFNDPKRYPIISSLINKHDKIDSELIMIEKSLSLLKTGGRLAIVVPDSVVSAKGIYGNFRKKLLELYDVKAVISIPSETFAQAGTRTKCVILYIEKNKSIANNIFFSTCEDIGYIVKNKKGLPVKILQGYNEMHEIAQNYCKKNMSEVNNVLNFTPSCTIVNQDSDLINDSLTPGFYNAEMLKHQKLFNLSSNLSVYKLSDLVNFDYKKRKKMETDENTEHISVLHVNDDTTINFTEVKKFNPISKGIECRENDIIFSKINPRISRVAVIPHYSKQLVCSYEFEVLSPKENVDPYLLSILLKSDIVKSQLHNLTSGTSSSHNRIKREELMELKIVYPDTLNNIDTNQISNIIKQKYDAHDKFHKINQEINNGINFN